MNKKRTTNPKKQITKILGIGKIDFTFTLELNEEDESKLNLSIDNIDSLDKLKFLSEKSPYWDRISLTSNSFMINTLIYLNKVSKHKTFVEFASLAPITYSEDELFLKNVITHCTEHNFLFINENDIIPFYKTIMNFVIKKGETTITQFQLC